MSSKDNKYWQLMSKVLELDFDTLVQYVKRTDYFQLMTERIQYYYNKLLPVVAQKVDISLTSLNRQCNSIELLYPNTEERKFVNGWIEIENDRFNIFINFPLISYFHRMSTLWSTRLGVQDDSGRPIEDPNFIFDDTVQMSRHFMELYYDNKIDTKNPIVSLLNLGRSQILFSSCLLNAGLLFVIAHEFGHLIVYLNKDKISDIFGWVTVQAQKMLSALVSKYPQLFRSYDINNLTQWWVEEFAADIIGSTLVWSSAEDNVHKAFGIWAPGLFFLTEDILEQFYFIRYNKDFPLTKHPFSKLRLVMLRAAQYESLPDLMEFIDSAEDISRGISKSMGLCNHKILLNEIQANLIFRSYKEAEEILLNKK